MINDIADEYFDWLINLVGIKSYADSVSYKKLLAHLHSVEFRYSISMDSNRASDGINMRWNYVCESRYSKDEYDDILNALDGPCSVLEMMVALADRCEKTIMDDPQYGNRTSQWFWKMIVNLGLGDMYDGRFDVYRADYVINRFLDRDYEPNGKGGLFTVDCGKDLRTVEIWHQLCWYLDTIV